MTQKKSTLLLAGLMALTQGAQADEGMWPIYNLPQAVYETMRQEGFQLSYADLYEGEGALKNAVVNFSDYCSGVVVSPDGLVFTNHHCGFESIRSHSTVEHDYMLKGFYAKTYEEELPNEGMFVSFMTGQQDVTDRVQATGYETATTERKEELIDSLQQVMTDEARREDSTLHVVIDAFYEGNKWYATTYRDFNDLRLVFAIPKSMGKFGGEIDNWMWPRQTCDFSVFRIYADPKTGGPAAYSKDNVPYHPKRWAKISTDGYKEGDYAMTMGYPGGTERYLSSYGIEQMRDCENTPRAQVRGVKQQVMWRHMTASESVRIKYDSKYAQSSNYWKNSLGMNKCIDSLGIISLKREYEDRLRFWQDTAQAAKQLAHKVDFDRLKQLYKDNAEAAFVWTNFSETFTRRSNVEFSTRALRVLDGMEVKGDDRKKEKQYHEFADNSDQWDEATDKEIMATLLENYRTRIGKKYLPAFYSVIDKDFGGDCQKYVDYLWKKSVLMKKGEKIYFNKKSFTADPGVEFGLDLIDLRTTLLETLQANAEEIAKQEQYLCAAKLRMEEDMPHYSDANFTMRLSYGQVGGFDLGGKPSGYYTTAESMMEKMSLGDKIQDYYAEPQMHQLMAAQSYGPYQDKETGKLHLCFLTNNDITGGNSGSPMFNGKGELIGLAFDGNWESLSSDINFDKRLARCIGVDIRYVLYMMDKWGQAERLLKEIREF